MERPQIGVGVFIRNSMGEYLLGIRISKTHGDGEWSLPGGHLEAGESFIDCCKRECREETGLEIDNIRLITATNDIFRQEDLHYVTLFFGADHVLGHVVNTEPEKCAGWEWKSLENLPEPAFYGIHDAVAAMKQKCAACR